MAKKLDFIQKFLFFFIKLKQIQKDYDINRSSKNQKSMLCSCHVITNTGKYAINSTFGRDKSFNVIPPENTCCYLDSGFKLEQQEIVLLCLATHFSLLCKPAVISVPQSCSRCL